MQGDRQRQGSRIPVHHEGEHRSRRVRRKRRARSWQHRTARRDAGHGGESGALQGVWRRECRPHLPRHTGHRGDHQGSHLARTGLRRHQSRGHQRPALLRDRGAPKRDPRHPRIPRRPARHRDRRPRRHHQRPQSCRKTERKLPGRRERCRQCRRRHHKAPADIRLYKRDPVRQGGHRVNLHRRSQLDAGKDGRDHQPGSYDRNTRGCPERRGHFCRCLRAEYRHA